MDGNIKQKVFDSDQVFVLNHEANTIYNDIVKFRSEQMEEALKQFDQYPKEDATILMRSSDGQLLKKKGEENYIGQNLAYLYNDSEQQGKVIDQPYSMSQFQIEG